MIWLFFLKDEKKKNWKVRIKNVCRDTEHGWVSMQCGAFGACTGQHVPGPLNHLSGGVITALWDATQPSNTQGALQRRHLLRKYSQRAAGRETLREVGEEVEGGVDLGCPLASSRLIFWLTKQYCWVSLCVCVCERTKVGGRFRLAKQTRREGGRSTKMRELLHFLFFCFLIQSNKSFTVS